MTKLNVNKIGLVTKPGSKEAIKKAEEIGYWLLGHQYKVYMLSNVEVIEGIGFQKVSEKAMSDDMDLLILFGGDGLVLYWGKRVASRTKLIAVDFGHYGFITDINPPNATEDIGRILDGLYCTQDRYQLRAAHNYCGINVIYRAMNEVVLSMISGTRLSPIRIEIGSTLLTNIHCTELLVATPTGSTAQSMSAGGPIVHPDLPCLIITPICPHTLNSRPIVIPAGHDITLIPSVDMLLSADGVSAPRHVKAGENMVVKLLTMDPAQTLHIRNDGFYTKLHDKMRWGERF